MNRCYKQVVKERMAKKYPEMDLLYFDRYYDIILEETHKRYKLNASLCYNKRCKNRMV